MNQFAFGQNWSDFSRLLDANRLEEAERGIARLVGDVRGKTFLDIGCGSGLHAVAAAKLGASVTAIDLDPISVDTAKRVARHYGQDVHIEVGSAFDVSQPFDVVYSWGVLHHTGDMWRAIDHVSSHANERLALALYTKSPMCPLWKIEKRLYCRAPALQPPIRALYKLAYVAGLLGTGRNPITYIRDYAKNRGMNWSHDVHDWLGGYPYESASPHEVGSFLAARGFTLTSQAYRPAPLAGILGTGCSEYLFARADHA